MMNGLYNWLGGLSDRIALAAYGHDGPGGAAFLPHFRARQLHSITSLTRVMMVANVVIVGAFILLQRMLGQMSPADAVWAGALLLLAFSVYRPLHRRGPVSPRRTASARSVGKLVVSSVVLASLWIYPLGIIAGGARDVEAAFIVSLVAGVITGGAIVLYPVPIAVAAHVGVLTLASMRAMILGYAGYGLPFGIITTVFYVVVVVAVIRQHRIFAEVFRARIEAEFERELRDLLIGNAQTRSDSCIWQADAGLHLITDGEPVCRILRLPGDCGQRQLGWLLGLAGARAEGTEGEAALAALMEPEGAPLPAAFSLRLRIGPGGAAERVIDLVGKRIDLQQSSGTYYNGYFKDVTEEVTAMAEVHRLVTHDAMTGLPNHAEFLRRVGAVLEGAAAAPARAHVAMFFIDADNLKRTNDGFGHAAGDALLVAIAARLRQCPGIACRKGGDEFVLFELCGSFEDYQDAAIALHQKLNGIYTHGGRKMPLRCTIGATVALAGEKSIERMEFEADVALKHQKKVERSRLGSYSESLGIARKRETMAAFDLRRAIREAELVLEYQPIVGADDQRVRAVEALLRWHHPELGAIAPPTIIEIAASEGCSTELNEFILATALAECRTLPDDIALSINVSATEIDRPEFAASVLRLAARHGRRPEMLWLEITEEQYLPRSPTVRSNIQILRARGIRLALDDFGAGYSSLCSLDDIDCDVIKLDRSLVSGCAQRPNSLTMIVSLCGISHSLGRIVVLEGIEDAADVAALAVTGATLFQGFLFHRPMRIDGLQAVLRAEGGEPDARAMEGRAGLRPSGTG